MVLTDEDRTLAARALEPVDGHYAAFVVGAAWPLKRWPTSSYVELGRRLVAERGLQVVTVGGPDDQACDDIKSQIGQGAHSLRGKLGLTEALAVLERAALVVGNDTGLIHGAEAVGRDVLSILGPTSRQTGAYPHRTGSRVLEVNLPCRPCSQKGDRRCRLPHQECMRRLTPAIAFKAASQMCDRLVQSKESPCALESVQPEAGHRSHAGRRPGVES